MSLPCAAPRLAVKRRVRQGNQRTTRTSSRADQQAENRRTSKRDLINSWLVVIGIETLPIDRTQTSGRHRQLSRAGKSIAVDLRPWSKTALTVLSTRFDDRDPSKYWTRAPNSRGSLPSTGRRSNTDQRRSKGRRNSTAPP